MKWVYLAVLAALYATSPSVALAAKCVGSADCRACSNCSRCGHCKSGGSRGVCARVRAPSEAPAPDRVPQPAPAPESDWAPAPGSDPRIVEDPPAGKAKAKASASKKIGKSKVRRTPRPKRAEGKAKPRAVEDGSAST